MQDFPFTYALQSHLFRQRYCTVKLALPYLVVNARDTEQSSRVTLSYMCIRSDGHTKTLQGKRNPESAPPFNPDCEE